MNVILLTVFIGLILVGLAIVFFFYARAASEGSSPEQDSLMPLQEETTRPAGGKTKISQAPGEGRS